MEIGWTTRRDAENLYDNEFLHERAEIKANLLVSTEIEKVQKDISVLMKLVNCKLTTMSRFRWLQVSFTRWKQLSYIAELKYRRE